ncbi:Nn.00g020790.m01.CDS01 [Neocucurbitaria sp. VM-36]
MERNRTISFGTDSSSINTPLVPYDPPESYNGGDIAMQNVDTTYTNSPPIASPEMIESKNGAYTYIGTPGSTFDAEEGHHHHHHHHHVKRFDHNESRKNLLKTGASKLLITIFFSAAICLCLKAWEGFRTPVVLSKNDVRIFNALLIGLSLCLGLNILASLKHYASTFRWSFLTRRYVTLEVFDLILHLSSLAKVTKLMIISSPGFRGRTFLRRFRWFKDVRDDGTKWMWLACLLWLAINIGSQILVALLSLFWPMSNSEMPLLTYGNVTVADLNTWYLETNPEPDTKSMGNETSLEAAWMFGMEAMVYPEFALDDIKKDFSNMPGTPLYKGDGSYKYRFFNRDPTHQYTNYLVSSREVSAVTTCEQLEVRGNGTVIDTDEEVKEFGSMYIEGKEPGKDWDKYAIPEQASGAITWIASVQEFCGPRCTNFTVLQYGFDDRVKTTSLFLCNSTLGNVTKAHAEDDITTYSGADEAAVYGSNDFARIAAGAIGWTGIPWNNWIDRQTRSYSQGSKWSPAKVVSKQEVEDMLMRFTIGAVAAFDDHGIRYNMTSQRVVPTQGQQLDVDWSYIFSILGGICGIQFFALCLLVFFANRTIVRDDSFFSMAMLLSPVVERIGKLGMNMSGEEIKDHPRLKWKKIRYDYREGKDGEPNQVDIFFEGKDQKDARKSWAPGSYS